MGEIQYEKIVMPVFDNNNNRKQVALLFSGDNIDKLVFQQNLANFIRGLEEERCERIQEALSVGDCFDATPFREIEDKPSANKEYARESLPWPQHTYTQNLCNGEYTTGLTPLTYATAFHRTTDCMEILLQNGADPNQVDSHGRFPLDYADSQEKVKLLKTCEARVRSNKFYKPLMVREIRPLQEMQLVDKQFVDQQVVYKKLFQAFFLGGLFAAWYYNI